MSHTFYELSQPGPPIHFKQINLRLISLEGEGFLQKRMYNYLHFEEWRRKRGFQAEKIAQAKFWKVYLAK